MKVSSRNILETAFIQEQLAKSAAKHLVSQTFNAQAPAGKPGDKRGTPAGSKASPLATAKPAVARPVQRKAHEIRLIGGLWKRTKLPVANHPGLRPTPDRVRETLFNWLGQDMSGLRCADAFAGTGALGLEAASRGAADVLLMESESKLVAQLQAIKTKLKADTVRIQRGDGIAMLLALPRASVDVVFIDPPFEAPIFDKALAAAAHAVSAQGAIYLEAPKAWGDDELAAFGLQVARSGKAGMVHYHLLKRAGKG
jgi:16S rRNA (guanine966-N2)-methyltransferase